MLFKECDKQDSSLYRAAIVCTDYIFVLISVIQIHISIPGRKAFASFNDSKKAFPSINRDLLWRKLLSLGVSVKFIRLMKSIYDAASMSIRILQCTAATDEVV